MRVHLTTCLVLSIGLIIGGCAAKPIERKTGAASQRSYGLSDVAKSDVDRISELTQHEVLEGLHRLTVKLYKRNPAEYRKSGFVDAEQAAAALFDEVSHWETSNLAKLDWEARFRQAFDAVHEADRVHTYMSALLSMVMASYEQRTAFYLADALDAQKLYNSARNIEVAAWKLANAKLTNGQPVLVSNSMDGDVRNLSFEREIGKLIGQQDVLALIMEDRDNRSITRVLQNVALFAFLPL